MNGARLVYLSTDKTTCKWPRTHDTKAGTRTSKSKREQERNNTMIELSSNDKTNAPLAATAAPPWTIALLAAALYPSLQGLFPMAMQRYSTAQSAALQSAW